jgi:hypothetical protein
MIAVRYAMPAAWCSHMLARELAGFQTICCKQSGSPNVIEGQNRTSVMTRTFFTVGGWTTSRADSTISR